MSGLKKSAATNLSFAVAAQMISMLLSVFTTLMLPKVLNKEGYGMWQLFMLYASYAGVFHLGLNDGLYLRIGGKNYSELNYRSIGAQFKIGVLYETVLAILVCGILFAIEQDVARRLIVVEFAVYIIIMNAVNFIGFVFQAVNQTKIYSISILIDKLCFLVMSIVLILMGVDDYRVYTMLYIASWVIVLIYVLWVGRKFVFIRTGNWRSYLTETGENIQSGVKLLISNLASLLILGIGRFLIDSHWDMESFADISLAITLMNFFVNFIKQTSIILFPMLRKLEVDMQKLFYETVDTILKIILPVILVCYLPLRTITVLWLPKYEISLEYLAILLPICVYEGQMQILSNTYLKVLRAENSMLYTNLIAMAISVILCLVSAVVFRSVYAIVFSMTIAIHVRSLIVDNYLSKRMDLAGKHNLMVQEVLLTMLFCIGTIMLNYLVVSGISLIVYLVYVMANRKKLGAACRGFKRLMNEIA